ncbi:hypothetical protein V1477_004989 [Vespula maculifrons]|uniref:Uncharacterized protein n=1 Tax=Vespula maculifrons TaxID=7453 RepID=A0ABD2CND3_VESMC
MKNNIYVGEVLSDCMKIYLNYIQQCQYVAIRNGDETENELKCIKKITDRSTHSYLLCFRRPQNRTYLHQCWVVAKEST